MDKYNIGLTSIIGYISLFYLAIKKLLFNYEKGYIIHMLHNFALIIASLFLGVYYYNEYINNISDLNNDTQRNIKIIGYSSYVINILLIIIYIPSLLKFNIFGIIGNSLMVYSTIYKLSHTPGLVFLIIYFLYKLILYIKFSYLEIFTSFMLLVYYSSLLIIDYNNTVNSKNITNTKLL